jgi:hypothetical protein
MVGGSFTGLYPPASVTRAPPAGGLVVAWAAGPPPQRGGGGGNKTPSLWEGVSRLIVLPPHNPIPAGGVGRIPPLSLGTDLHPCSGSWASHFSAGVPFGLPQWRLPTPTPGDRGSQWVRGTAPLSRGGLGDQHRPGGGGLAPYPLTPPDGLFFRARTPFSIVPPAGTAKRCCWRHFRGDVFGPQGRGQYGGWWFSVPGAPTIPRGVGGGRGSGHKLALGPPTAFFFTKISPSNHHPHRIILQN